MIFPHSADRPLRVIGLMSGTSCDGLDIAVVDVFPSGHSPLFETVAGGTVTYSAQQRQQILEFITSPQVSLQHVSQFNFYLAQTWAEFISKFLSRHTINKDSIDLIGSHGQTVWHQPQKIDFAGSAMTSTLQLGDPAVLAQLCGIAAVGDFRVADVALGGQGAPLVPYFDWLYFKNDPQDTIALNLGGISNFSYIPAGQPKESVLAGDCGPGMMLIDQLMERLYEEPGTGAAVKAKMGSFSERLFRHLKKIDDFVEKPFPKSTGREQYGREFVMEILRIAIRYRIPEPVVLNTVSEYTAYAIYRNYEINVRPKAGREFKLVVSGGGRKNDFVMQKLKQYFQTAEVIKSDQVKLDGDLKEAVCFAVLAAELIRGNPAGMPQISGASSTALLGKFCPVQISN